MTEAKHRTILLADYRSPDYLIKKTELVFELDEAETLVRSKLEIVANYDHASGVRPLKLDGRELLLRKISLSGKELTVDSYTISDTQLIIHDPPTEMVLEIENLIQPAKNTALEGLYKSGDKLCTQCEAEGFRRITWFADRPDVLSRFEVTLIGDPEKFPVMLANGNLIEKGSLDDGRHWLKWQDPFPKPSYLFALVAGKLSLVEDYYTTMSGRRVALQFFVEEHNLDRCDHALESLKKAMKWDEDTFGLEYDLDQYMVVAVDDFNMGAMENKGLNVFNSKYVLASPATATDLDYENIEAVIAHEYFHNWTGNRVTCRDWFQLSLKEGLTVFRDQEFSADMTSRSVKRISDVAMLRSRQFPEDSGPMAHPVRTGSYIEINNFYTLTVYEKGAELVRMIHTLIGADNFRRGLRSYLERHDGQAATVEDFVEAMAEAGGCDLGQFMNWYSQAGTPVLRVESSYDPTAKVFTLNFKQSCPASPGQKDKEPFHIPIKLGLLAADGRELPLKLAGADQRENDGLLELRERQQVYRFEGISAAPVPSLLRGFSAPVKIDYDYSDAELGLLMAHDRDPFCRWEAGQNLAVRVIMALAADHLADRQMVVPEGLVDNYRLLLSGQGEEDASYLALLLTLPSEDYLAEFSEVIEVEAIHAARELVRKALASGLEDEFRRCHAVNLDLGEYRYDPVLAGRRQLKNLCLAYLVMLDKPAYEEMCFQQFREADNMSDEISSLRIMVHSGLKRAGEALEIFADKWRDDPLVMDKWLAVQATVPRQETLEKVRGLTAHPAFDLKNPNRVRSLLGAFSQANPLAFNRADGEAYVFMAERIIELDRINPQIAARMAGCFGRWRRFSTDLQAKMKQQLEWISKTEKISGDLYEVVMKTLDHK